ncbi:MAG TPA: phosphoribulokinase [Gemmatimonadales bacterium]
MGSPQVGSPVQLQSTDKERTTPFGAGRPIMLCLVGDSGAGKSTLSDGCMQILGPEQVTDICLDDYHAYDRVGRQERHITALHPDCNHLDLMGQHMRLLRQGQRVFKPVYDHSNGTFGPPELVAPRSIVFVHGLHGLYTPDLRRQWDVSVYLDPDPELRVAWKIKRDTTKRGYNREQVLEQLRHRQHDVEAYIQPQRDGADIVISFCPPPDYEVTRDNTRLNVRITLRHPVPLPDVAEAVAAAERRNGGYLRLERGADGRDLLEIGGAISDAAMAAVEERMWSHMPAARHLRSSRLGVFQDGDTARRSNPLAVTQLILTYYLVKASALALKEEQLART